MKCRCQSNKFNCHILIIACEKEYLECVKYLLLILQLILLGTMMYSTVYVFITRFYPCLPVQHKFPVFPIWKLIENIIKLNVAFSCLTNSISPAFRFVCERWCKRIKTQKLDTKQNPSYLAKVKTLHASRWL